MEVKSLGTHVTIRLNLIPPPPPPTPSPPRHKKNVVFCAPFTLKTDL